MRKFKRRYNKKKRVVTALIASATAITSTAVPMIAPVIAHAETETEQTQQNNPVEEETKEEQAPIMVGATAVPKVDDEPTPVTKEYEGDSRKLLDAGGTFKDKSIKMYYSLDEKTWTDKYADIKGTDVGEYKVFYGYKEGNDYHTIDFVESEITDPSVKTEPKGNTLDFNDEDQQLIKTAGEFNNSDFDMYYRLEGEKEWEADYKDITAKDAGTYTIEYGYKNAKNEYVKIDDITAEIKEVSEDAPTLIREPVANKSLVYTEGYQELIATDGKLSEGEMCYTIDGKIWYENYKEVKAKYSNDYTVYYGYKKSDGTYKVIDLVNARINDPVATKKPVGLTKIYNGKEQMLISGAGTLSGGDMYYSIDGGKHWYSDIKYITGKEAKKYTINYGFKKGINTYESLGTITAEIKKETAPSVTKAPTVNTGLIYTGNAQDLLKSAGTLSEGKMIYSLDGEKWFDNFRDVEATNVNEYIIQFGYENADGDKITLGETKAEIKAPLVTKKPEGAVKVYNGKFQGLIALEGKLSGGDMYYSFDGEYWTKDISKVVKKDIKNYEIQYGYKKAENRYVQLGTITAEIYKEEAPEVITEPEVKSGLIYTGHSQDLLESGGTLAGDKKMYYSLDGEEWTDNISNIEGRYVNEYKVYYGYKKADGTYEKIGEVTAKINDPIVTKPVVAAEKIYNGSSQVLIAEGGTLSGGQMYYSLDGKNWYDNLSYIRGKSIGEYSVQYGYKKDSTTFVALGSVTAKIVAPAATKAPVSKGSIIYSGDDETLLASGGTLTSGDMYYRIMGTSEVTKDIKNIKGNDPKDYIIEYGYMGEEGFAKIDEVKTTIVRGEVQTVPVGKVTPYNGMDQSLIESGGTLKDGRDMYYSLDGKEWTTDINAVVKKDIKTYTILYGYRAGFNDFVTLGEITAQITAPEATVTPIAKANIEYNGLDQKLLAYGGQLSGGMAMSYRVNGGKSVYNIDLIQGNKMGNYTIDYGYEYKGSFVKLGDISAQIVAPIVENKPLVKLNLVYNGDSQKLIAKGGSLSTGRSMYYTVFEIKWTKDYTVFEGTDAGDYVITYGYDNGISYSDLGEVTATIAKATLTKDMLDVECPDEPIMYDGNEHVAIAFLKEEYSGATFDIVYRDEDGELIAGAPKKVGRYTVEAAVKAESTNFVEGYTEIGTIEIESNSGWKVIDGKTYYYVDGTPLKGWQTIDGYRYWLDHEDGSMHTEDWYTTEYGNKYYVGANGRMVTGWQTIDGDRYWFEDCGRMNKNKWYLTEYGNKYYVGSDGKMVINWQTIDGKRYWFEECGRMNKDRWYTTEYGNKYYVGSDGVMFTGWHTIDGDRYWFDANGRMQKNRWYTTEYGNKYYVLETGKAARNGTWRLTMEDGSLKKCTFNSVGRLIRAV